MTSLRLYMRHLQQPEVRRTTTATFTLRVGMGRIFGKRVGLGWDKPFTSWVGSTHGLRFVGWAGWVGVTKQKVSKINMLLLKRAKKKYY